ncbi:zinc phosphodiesterase ELAC protein 2-like isoform X2 [Limulus polyphemus]|nr:zinc phosphodiesterase ELAC protein 2-like isoform X2 [Limulus polyphemus]XP_022237061.1 zinc phosphodiesterase ELAC protein 2-like isoform X2 [Limulus polyphemus]XP_022237062.1 zinc phosphodiesterase ELAC protein 2-like isoform X2 [Limulus polyphemus]
MPKEPKASNELRHIRMRAKAVNNKPKPTPNEICLHVLGNGGPGNPRCLYMFTDHARYIFNCGEGTQRLAHEHKMKLAKLEHVFFTYKSWENIGGLPGLSLTIQDIGVPEITLHGPPNIEEIYDMTKGFMVTKNLQIVSRNHKHGSFTDNCMTVHYVPIYSSVTASSRKTDMENSYDNDHVISLGDGSSHQQNNYCESLDSVNPEQVKKRQKTEAVLENEDISVAYICKLHNKAGTLILEKCVEHGVPAGPLLGELKKGNNVTLPNGKVVKSTDVVTPEEIGPVFIVVECPSEHFVDSLVNNKEFQAHQVTASSDENLAMLVVHFTPSDVMAHPKYQDWLLKFSGSCIHLVLNSSSPSLSSIAVHRVQHMLNILHPEIFSLLKQNSDVTSSVMNGIEHSVLAIPAESLMKFYLRPRKGLDRENVIQLDASSYVQEAYNSPGLEECVKELATKLNHFPNVNKQEGNEYPEVVFLGTGSSIPSKVRNVTSILVNISPQKSILLDCGEGTRGQILRYYGIEEGNSILRQISCIFVSHLHADHHLGLIEVLKARNLAFIQQGERNSPVDLLAPKQIIHWLQNYHSRYEPVLHLFRLVPNFLLTHNNGTLPKEVYQDLINRLNLQELSTVPVKHCKSAFGVTLTPVSGKKLVYSGDTMPCEGLIEAGLDCGLLIHEATMEDELEEEAKIKTHSTTSQAIKVGANMRADFTLLTHFSQRYAKVPLFNDNFHNTVGCAFDNMKVRPCDLPILPLLLPSLKCLFHEHYEEMQEKTAKRQRRNRAPQTP